MSKIVFFGSSDFAVPSLKSLCDSKMTPVAAVTLPDKPRGRGQKESPVPVKSASLNLGVPVFQFDSLKSEKFRELLKNLKPELAVVASYGLLIPKEILEMIPSGFLNIHPSLLPKHRGPTPIQTVILEGEKETGISIMLLDEKMDHGPIVAQKKVKITASEDFGSLHDKLAIVGAELLVKSIPGFLSEKIVPSAQDDSKATFTKLLQKNDGEIKWSDTAQNIQRQIRALSPSPAAWAMLSGKRIKIIKVTQSDNVENPPPPGYVSFCDGQLYVECGEGRLRIDTMKPESRSIMSGSEFFRGCRERPIIFS